MRRTSSVAWIVSGCLSVVICAGCTSQKEPAKTGSAAMKPAAINVAQISHLAPGDTLKDVIQEMGPPTDMKNNVYYYRQRGRIVFEGTGSPVDKTKVLRVESDAAEDGYP